MPKKIFARGLLLWAMLLCCCRPSQDELQRGDAAVLPGPGKDAAEEGGGAPDGAGDAGADDSAYEEVPPIPEYVADPGRNQATQDEWNDIVDSAKTEQLLLEGRILWGKTKARIKELTRLGAGVKRILFVCAIAGGGRTIKAQLKLPQENYHEWKSEINAYRIGKRIGLTLPPVVLRYFKRTDFDRLGKPLAPEELDLIRWSGATGAWIRGSLRFWVESLNSRTIGGRTADEDYLLEIARAIHPGSREKLIKDYPIYLDMGRGFLFDYLINNNDRARNMGTLLLPDGSEKLILFDQGLAFGAESKKEKRSFLYLDAMQMMPADVIGKLRSLTEEELGGLLVQGNDKKADLSPELVAQIWERRSVILKRAGELAAAWGDAALY